MMTAKVGMSKSTLVTEEIKSTRVESFLILESNDPEFDEYQRKFASIEGATDKLLKDSKVFCENVMGETLDSISAWFLAESFILKLFCMLVPVLQPISRPFSTQSPESTT